MTDSDRQEVVAIITEVLADKPWGQGDVDTANQIVDALERESWLP
jgi:hypothetical protein